MDLDQPEYSAEAALGRSQPTLSDEWQARFHQELAMILEALEARIRALEGKFNVNGAFRGAGVSMPKYGVGAKGFNAFDENTGFFNEGADLPEFKYEGKRLAFRKGVLVDLDRRVY